MKPALRFLTTEQVIEIHDDLLRRFGGIAGGGPRGEAYEGVEAAVQAVKNSYYDSVDELAAAYAVYIVQGHVFMDGNKRAGAAAMLVFLEANGIRTAVSPGDLPALMIDLQRRSEAGDGTDDLVSWLTAVLVPTKPRSKRRRKGKS